MKRILLVSSLTVPGVLFAVERSLIYLLFISATIILYLLFVITHRKPASERAIRGLTVIGQSDARNKNGRTSWINP
jgi:hypothetical protein